jgi:alcohol dehydrogenase
MRALTYHGPFDVRVTDVADPQPFDAEAAVVAVRACGTCGSDLHIYEGHGFSPDLGFCVGHEAVGEVVEVGGAVTRFGVGDSVLVPGSVGCATCGLCRAGYVLGCERNRSGCYGLGALLPGSQAQAVAVPSADGNLVAIPEGVSDDAALVLTDNAPTAWYGARRARIAPGDVVAVIGPGPVGIMSVLAAQIMGASRVLAIDLVPERRAAAAALGAEPVEGDPRVAVRELTGGRGAGVVLEAVGADATIDLAMKIAARGTRCACVGRRREPERELRDAHGARPVQRARVRDRAVLRAARAPGVARVDVVRSTSAGGGRHPSPRAQRGRRGLPALPRTRRWSGQGVLDPAA